MTKGEKVFIVLWLMAAAFVAGGETGRHIEQKRLTGLHQSLVDIYENTIETQRKSITELQSQYTKQCEQNAAPIVLNPIIKWNSDEEVVSTRIAAYNHDKPKEQHAAALAQIGYSNGALVRDCEIWTEIPTGEDDYYRMMKLGHEVWHCVAGSYHD